MAKTGTVVIDGDSTPDPITASVPCRKVTVWPTDTDVTGGYFKYTPTALSTPAKLSDGEKCIFEAPFGSKFPAGCIVGYMKTGNAGPFTMNFECT